MIDLHLRATLDCAALSYTDRIWVATRPGVLPDETLRRWAGRIVWRAIRRVPYKDPRPGIVASLLEAGMPVPHDLQLAVNVAASEATSSFKRTKGFTIEAYEAATRTYAAEAAFASSQTQFFKAATNAASAAHSATYAEALSDELKALAAIDAERRAQFEELLAAL